MRWEVMGAVVSALRDADILRGVDVFGGWPGDRNVTAEMVWIGADVRGNSEIPVATAGRKQYDDKFSFPLEIRIVGRESLEAAAARSSDVMAAVLDTMQTDPTLGNLADLVTATVDSMRGPYAEVTPDGPMAWAEITVSAHLRII